MKGWIATFAWLVGGPVLHSQGFGTISGTILDSSGAAVPRAAVTATESGTGLTRSAISSADGFFTIPSLRPTEYSVAVTADGFRKYARSGVILLADQSLTLTIDLEVGATNDSVVVTADAQQVDTTTQTIRQVVDEARIGGIASKRTQRGAAHAAGGGRSDFY